MKISTPLNAQILNAIPEPGDSEVTLLPLVVKALPLPLPTYQSISFSAVANENSVGTSGQIGQTVGAGSSTVNLISGCKGTWDILISGVSTISGGSGSTQTIITFSILSLDATRTIATIALLCPFSDSARSDGYINVQRVITVVESWRLQAGIFSTAGLTHDATLTAHANRLL